jgi:hypothetical protein
MIYIFKLGSFGERMADMAKDISMMVMGPGGLTDYRLGDHCEIVLKNLRSLRASLGDVPLSPALVGQWDRCERRLQKLTEDERKVGATLLFELQSHLSDELGQKVFLALDNDDAKLFVQIDPFGEAVSTLFPQATTDIYEGARCVALERYTAAVFHLMRAAEHALRYLAAEVGVADIEKKDFGQLVQETRAKHDALKSRDPEKKWTADALVALDLFKDAWRNPVSHSLKDQYTEERARDVYNGTRAFMQSLTRRAARGDTTTSP